MHKFIVIFIFLLFTNCKQNPVIKTHGVTFLDQKHKKLTINQMNKNDIRISLGNPSVVAPFDDSLWIYIERTKTRGKLLKFGQNVTSKNNVLALKFDDYGILIKKDFYDKNKINDVKFVNSTTDTVEREQSFVYSFLSSIRQKINKPVKNNK